MRIAPQPPLPVLPPLLFLLPLGGSRRAPSSGFVSALSVPRRSPSWEVFLADAESRRSLGEVLTDAENANEAFRTVFGSDGERGEYMDGYPEGSMLDRCVEDYGWPAAAKDDGDSALAIERAKMMAFLYDDDDDENDNENENDGSLWKHACMVAFSERYVLSGCDVGCDDDLGKEPDDDDEVFFEHRDDDLAEPYEVFRARRDRADDRPPIFAGVVLEHHRLFTLDDDDRLSDDLDRFADRGIDYVRLHCPLVGGGCFDDDDDDGADARMLGKVAAAALECQDRGMVPLVLLQVPWRTVGDDDDTADAYASYSEALRSGAFHLAEALRKRGVLPRYLLLGVRPPMGISARTESALPASDRIALGERAGREVFGILREAFDAFYADHDDDDDGDDHFPLGVCVAGGSTKGPNPTAMEDDTQAAVRRSIRELAVRELGRPLCFWEMGAKRMLQPEVGRLWWNGRRDGVRDPAAARDLFRRNAKALADEIRGVRPTTTAANDDDDASAERS